MDSDFEILTQYTVFVITLMKFLIVVDLYYIRIILFTILSYRDI